MDRAELSIKKEFVLEQIKSAFSGVTREGGISWREADALDSYGTIEVQAAERAKDTDQSWMEVALDPDWTIDHYDSNFSFLDKIGFRYYIAAAIVRHLVMDREAQFLMYQLEPPDSLDRWDFNESQQLAIASYVHYRVLDEQLRELLVELAAADMTFEEYTEVGETWVPGSFWQNALDYWQQFLPNR